MIRPLSVFREGPRLPLRGLRAQRSLQLRGDGAPGDSGTRGIAFSDDECSGGWSGPVWSSRLLGFLFRYLFGVPTCGSRVLKDQPVKVCLASGEMPGCPRKVLFESKQEPRVFRGPSDSMEGWGSQV